MENKEILRLIYGLDTGNPSTYKIEQLEKENSKLISSDKYMNDNFILMKRIQEQERCIKRLQGNKQNRESYIVNLEKRLQVKDKALDKAIDEIMSYQTLCPPTDYIDCKNEEQWKEWCENE